jgi:Flp pilus assembly protein TadG
MGMNQMLRLLLPVSARLIHRSFRRALRAWRGDCAGSVGPTLGLLFVVIIGFAGLGVEASNWYTTKRTMQGAADSAAYSAATSKGAGATTAVYTSEAKSVAGSYGFVDGSNGVTVTVNNPPTSGSHASDTNAIQVIIAQPQTLKFASLFLPALTLQAQAVATLTATGCVMALDSGSVTDVTDSGNTQLNLQNCNIVVNSSADNALVLSGSAEINANAAYISGNYTTSGQASLNTTNGTHTGVSPASDPYVDVQIPSYQGCDQNNYSINGGQSKTFTAGASGVMVFCNGMSITGGSSVTLDPGIYVIDRGSLSVSGNSSLTGDGVTIVFTSSTGQNYATASISGGATINLTAPTSGPTAGLAFFQDRNAPSNGSDSFTGGATQNITGAIYFPDQTVTFSGGTSSGNSASCTQLVALKFTFTGNSTFNNNNCAAAGVHGLGNSPVQLVQ